MTNNLLNPNQIYTIKTRSGHTTTMPTIRNLREARRLAHEFEAVLTTGPQEPEVQWNHTNHFVRSFGDVSRPSPTSPKAHHVEELVRFGAEQDGPLLVHCHAGISRSTATAIGVLIARGVDPEAAVQGLARIHPQGRPFMPNALMLAFMSDLLEEPDLVSIARSHYFNGRVEYR